MNSLAAWATPHTIANSIRMLRAQHRGAFLVVEGDSDARYFRSLIDTDQCHIQIAQGKSNVIGALDILRVDGLRGVLGVVDSDYSFITGQSVSNDNLVLTDSHDLETMILSSSALIKVLSEFGAHDKLQTLASQGMSVEAILIAAASPIGCLRLLSQTGNLNLKFDGINFKEFIDTITLAIDVPKMIATLKSHSNRPGIWEPSVQAEIVRLLGESYDPWHLCCGHDMVAILSMALTNSFGNAQPSHVHPKMIERSLRLAYEQVHFSRTRLFAAICRWEESNPPFVILRR